MHYVCLLIKVIPTQYTIEKGKYPWHFAVVGTTAGRCTLIPKYNTKYILCNIPCIYMCLKDLPRYDKPRPNPPQTHIPWATACTSSNENPYICSGTQSMWMMRSSYKIKCSTAGGSFAEVSSILCLCSWMEAL